MTPVMRKEAVYTLLLNVTLFHGMRCVLAQDPRYLRFSGIENGITTHYNLRVSGPWLLITPSSQDHYPGDIGIKCKDCTGAFRRD